MLNSIRLINVVRCTPKPRLSRLLSAAATNATGSSLEQGLAGPEGVRARGRAERVKYTRYSWPRILLLLRRHGIMLMHRQVIAQLI